MVTRLAGNEEGRGTGNKGNDIGNEGDGQGRWQGRQGNGVGNKGGRQADGNDDKEVDDNKDKVGGKQGRGEWQG